MREPCRECCQKHLGQALVLGCEMRKGYPSHFYLVIGHMAEAEDEICMVRPDIADKIRQERHNLFSDRNYMPDLLSICEELEEVITDADKERFPEK